jgi:Domain of unknown function (DUF4375)
MAIPRKLVKAALAALPVKTLRAMAEHEEVRGRDTMTAAQLVERLGWDSSNLAGFTMHMSAADLKTVADVFGIEDPGRTKGALSNAVWVFIVDYDKNKELVKAGLKKTEARDVFALAGKPGFDRALWAWIEERWNKIGYKKLTPGEQTLLRVRWLIQQINWNSFPGFFENFEDDMPAQVLDDLEKIGARKSAAALRKIGKMIFPRGVPAKQEARRDAMEGMEFDPIIDRADRLWDKTGEDLAELSVEYAAKHPKQFGA